jgi:hypothetical protein
MLRWLFGPRAPKHIHDWTMWEVNDAVSRTLRFAGVFQTRRCKTCGLVKSVTK